MLPKKTIRFIAASFCGDFAGALYGVCLPFMAMRFGADSIHLGIIGGAWALTYSFACPLAGYLSDRLSRRMLIVISALGQGVILLLTAKVNALWHLYIISPLWAICLSMFWPSLFGWMGDAHYSSELGRATGAVNLGWSAGAMTGGLIGGIFFRYHPAAPYMLGLVPLMTIVILMGTAREIRVGHAAGEEDGERIPTSRRKLIGAWMGAFSICCLAGLMYQVFPKFGSDNLGIDAAKFGKLLFMTGLFRSSIFLLGFRFSGKLQDWRFGVAALMLAAIMVGSSNFTSSFTWYAVIFMSLGIGLGINYFRGLYTSLESASSRGLKSAMHEGMLVAGNMVGSFGGGLLVFIMKDIRAPYLPLAGLTLLLGITQIILLYPRKNAASVEDIPPVEAFPGDAAGAVSAENQPLR